MAKKRESRLQIRIRHYLEQSFEDSWWVKFHGGPFTPAGVPDLLGCVGGVFIAMEVKNPGEEPSVIQERVMARMRKSGAQVAIVHNEREAHDFVREALRLSALRR